MMPARAEHSFEEHRGELEVSIDGPTLPALFAEAGRALAELMHATPLEPPAGCSDEVVVNAPDREALLVEWLNELVFRAEVEKALFTELVIVHLSERQLVATSHRPRPHGIARPRPPGLHGLPRSVTARPRQRSRSDTAMDRGRNA